MITCFNLPTTEITVNLTWKERVETIALTSSFQFELPIDSYKEDLGVECFCEVPGTEQVGEDT